MEAIIRFVTPVKWILHRRRLLAFAAVFGEGAAGEDTLRRLSGLDPVLLGRPDRTGTACAVAKLDGGTAGVALAVDRGREAFLVVVHPAARGRGVGTRLTRALLGRIGELECRIPAADSRAVAMCRRAGLEAIEAGEGAEDGFVRLKGVLKPKTEEPETEVRQAGVPVPAAAARERSARSERECEP